MKLIQTNNKDLFLIDLQTTYDKRGNFCKIYNYDFYKENGLETDLKEVYITDSYKDVLRGMHFQEAPFDHAKIVTVLDGMILDVVVDIRTDSPTYGEVYPFTLYSGKGMSLYIGKGFAHGFLVQSKHAVISYLVSSVYSPEHDTGVYWKSINFSWGISESEVIISDRDKNFRGIYDQNFISKN